MVTETQPFEPLPRTTVIRVAEFTVKLTTSVPPNLTEVAQVKLVPVMVTELPIAPEIGVKEVMLGGGI